MQILEVAIIGLGATLCIDLWAMILKRAAGVRSLDYCLLGRWVLHMPAGTLMHENIGSSPKKSHECTVGWTTHYSIGVVFAGLFVLLMSENWLKEPRLLPAVAFGIATVAVPFLTMQPAFGFGIAASRVKKPGAARLKSLMTHTIFGAGLYLWAMLLTLLPQ